jgi:hypothetical protein
MCTYILVVITVEMMDEVDEGLQNTISEFCLADSSTYLSLF